MKTKTFGERSGFTLPELLIVIAVIGLLAAIAVPSFVRAKQAAQKNTCIKHLEKIEAIKATFTRVDQQINEQAALCAYIYNPKNFVGSELVCPAGGTYNIGAVGIPATCSYPEHALPRKPR